MFITKRAYIAMFHGHCMVDTVSVFTEVAEPQGGLFRSVFIGVSRGAVLWTRCGLTH